MPSRSVLFGQVSKYPALPNTRMSCAFVGRPARACCLRPSFMFAFATSLRVVLGAVSDPAASVVTASACCDSTGTSGTLACGIAGVAETDVTGCCDSTATSASGIVGAAWGASAIVDTHNRGILLRTDQ